MSVSIKQKQSSRMLTLVRIMALATDSTLLGNSMKGTQSKAMVGSERAVNAESASTPATQSRAMHQQHDAQLNPVTTRAIEQVKYTLLLLLMSAPPYSKVLVSFAILVWCLSFLLVLVFFIKDLNPIGASELTRGVSSSNLGTNPSLFCCFLFIR